MPGRPLGAANLRTMEFIKAYNELLAKYPDPLEVCFRLLKSRKQTIQIQAATQLLQYRYPKLAAVKLEGERPAQMKLGWDEDPDTIDAPPPKELIDSIEAISNEQQ